MKDKKKIKQTQITGIAEESLFLDICSILETSRNHAARTVNSAHSISCWLIGWRMIEFEQTGKIRAEYGKTVLKNISLRLKAKYGSGFSVSGIQYMRAFYVQYPDFLEIQHAMRVKSQIQHTLFVKSEKSQFSNNNIASILKGSIEKPWKPGIHNPDLSWTHYRILLKIKRLDVRNFYEIETIKSGWTARELERQINSLLFERLLKSRDKKGLMALANKGNEIINPVDIMKDPFVLEFLDLPESHKLVETKLETALISKLKDFLLELGYGFAFIGRQKRLTLDGDHFYTDLVFYHIKLKCYVIIDLKTKKLTHGDIGQMLMYVNYYDREIKCKDDNPTLGLILCTEKNDTVVKYVLDEQQQQIFAGKYQFELPTEEELIVELKKELKQVNLSGTMDIHINN
jgi:predicted nuclease of restriction endonuclease-like (RecB) superfamily